MRNADAWIFTSVNAVAHAQRLDAGVWPRTIAVGAATAAALRRLDHEVELPDGAYTSEGVLALSALQSVAGRRSATVTGQHGCAAMEAGPRGAGAVGEVKAV